VADGKLDVKPWEAAGGTGGPSSCCCLLIKNQLILRVSPNKDFVLFSELIFAKN
jgi:hypothetical protein